MPGDIKVLQAVGDDTVAPPVATDRIAGRDFQKIKAGWGAAGVFQETTDTDGVRLPIGGAQVGALTETAPGSDTAASGLNGRLQRIAQRITSLIALLPTSLGQKTMANSLAVTLASDQPAQAVSGTITANAGTNLNTSALVLEANEATRLGIVTETAPASDIASSGLNGRLQRIAQNITTLIGRFPTTLGQKTMANGLAVTLASDQSALPTTAAQLPATLGQKPMATSLAVTLPSDQSAVPTAMARREAVIAMTVTSGGTLTGNHDTLGYGLFGLVVPAEFDGTAIQFQVSHDGGTYYPLYDITNTAVQMTVAPSRAYDLPGELSAWRYLRIVCVTAQTTTNTVFQLVLRS